MMFESNNFPSRNWAPLVMIFACWSPVIGQEAESKPLPWELLPQQISQTPSQSINAPAWIQCTPVATLNKGALATKAQFNADGSVTILEKTLLPQANQPGKGRLCFLEWNQETNQFDISPKKLEREESVLDFAADNNQLYLVTPGKLISILHSKNPSNQSQETVLLDYTHSNPKLLGGLGLQASADGWLFFFLPEGEGVLRAPKQKEIRIQGIGGLCRIRKDGSRLEVFCTGIAMPLNGYFQDSQGGMFLADSHNSKGSQTFGMGYYSIHQGADFGFRSRDFLSKFAMEDSSQFAEGLPGSLKPSCMAKDVQASSIFHYLGSGYPREIQDYCFSIVPGEKRVTAARVRKTGAGIFMDKPSSALEFKPDLEPVQMIQGPDGSIYALCNSGPGGLNQGSLFLKFTFKGASHESKGIKTLKESKQAFEASFEDLLKILEQNQEEQNTQLPNWLARHLQGSKEALCKLALEEGRSTSFRASVFSALVSQWDSEVQKTAMVLLESGEDILETLAARALGDFSPAKDTKSFNALLQHLGSDNSTFRREVILACGKTNAPGAADSLVNGMLFYDGNDPLILDAFTRGLEFTGAEGLDRLASVGDSGVRKDLRKALDILSAMRTEITASAISTWLKNVNLTSGDRAELIRSIRRHPLNNEDPYIVLFKSIIQSSPDKEEEKIALLESLRILKELQGEEILKWVEMRLKDESAETRKAAATTVRIKKIKNLKGPVSYKAFENCRFWG